ncbi:MAG: FMN-binding protein [Lachnospiraceae bacterium]|nr:FMN-binding protein [Lachnospiraceae bacterium]
MKEAVKSALVLFAITLVAGALLGAVYQVTKEPIRIQREIAKQKANQAAFPGAEFKDYEGFDKAAAAAVLSQDAAWSGVSIENVQEAVVDGQREGYVLQITSMGYGDEISWILGICDDGTVNGISLISINETPGLGMNAEKVLVPQFDDVPVPDSRFTVAKTDDNLTETINAISGATITSTAVTNGVNAGLTYYEQVIKEVH